MKSVNNSLVLVNNAVMLVNNPAVLATTRWCSSTTPSCSLITPSCSSKSLWCSSITLSCSLTTDFEAASEAARTARRDHIGARLDLDVITAELMEDVKLLDGMTRYRFGKDVEVMGEWEAARALLGQRRGVVGEVKNAA